jgi:citrate lyase subunit beta/citryl-CoA lyase
MLADHAPKSLTGEDSSGETTMLLRHARSLLFLPASNARAVAKARTVPCDLVILDLEDAVPDDRKAEARAGAVAALAEGFGERLAAVRINVEGAPSHGIEMVAMKGSAADYIVLPKVERAKQVKDVFSVTQKPVIAMIESAKGVLAAREIAAAE